MEKMKEFVQGAKEAICETTQKVTDQAQQASETVRQKADHPQAESTKHVDGQDHERDKESSDETTKDATKRFDDVAAQTVEDHALENTADAENKGIDSTSDAKESSSAAKDIKEKEHETEKAFLGD